MDGTEEAGKQFVSHSLNFSDNNYDIKGEKQVCSSSSYLSFWGPGAVGLGLSPSVSVSDSGLCIVIIKKEVLEGVLLSHILLSPVKECNVNGKKQ